LNESKDKTSTDTLTPAAVLLAFQSRMALILDQALDAFDEAQAGIASLVAGAKDQAILEMISKLQAPTISAVPLAPAAPPVVSTVPAPTQDDEDDEQELSSIKDGVGSEARSEPYFG
jgi:hypothetical protein